MSVTSIGTPTLLSAKELNALLGIKLDINPKNVSVELEYSPEPVLRVSIIVKFFFRSILINDENISLDPDHFSESHLLPIPTIRNLNGVTPTNTTGRPIVVKLRMEDDEAKKMLVLLEEKAVNPKAMKEIKKHLKVEYFKSTQKYEFRVPLTGFTAGVRGFPADVHHQRLAITLEPVVTYSNDQFNLFELKIPGHKGKALKRKENFYPQIEVAPWQLNADAFVLESILEFDFAPSSLSISSCSPLSLPTKKSSALISFTLIRHVLGPAMNALLPIYVVALLIPFAAFLTLDTYDGVAGYLTTLLLTLVAHRQIVSDVQTAVLAFTAADFDFVVGLGAIASQMVLFLFVVQLNGNESIIELDPIYIFAIEEVLIGLWILARFLWMRAVYKTLLDSRNFTNLRSQSRPISVREYRELRRQRLVLQETVGERVDQKTFFSTNIKILLGRQAAASDNTKLPASDVFRVRVYKDQNAHTVLQRIKEDPSFSEEYVKRLPGSDGDTRGPACKVIYCYTRKNQRLLLEVQFVSHKDTFTAESHRQYKRRLLKESLEVKGLCFTSGTVVSLFFKSLFIELSTCISYGRFWTRIGDDWRLLFLLLPLMKQYRRHGLAAPTVNQDVKYKEEVTHLLDQGRFLPKQD